jgi:plastocyanin
VRVIDPEEECCVKPRPALLVLALATAALVSPSLAMARTKTVFVGGPVKWANSLRYGASLNNFLINRVIINVGDTVVWNGASLGNGFHTVDIPKLNGSDLAVFTATGNTVQGANDAAGSPFWFNGHVPVLSFNTMLFGPSGSKGYNGTTRVESGLPLGGKPADFKVKFLTAGVFKYFCDVHYGMAGDVVVKPKGAPVPTAQQDAAKLRSEEQHYVTEAKRVAKTKVPTNQVSLGVSGPGGLELYTMFPNTLRIKAGTTVRFFMPKDTREDHTATFGPVSYLKPLAKSFQSPAPAPAAVYPSDPPGQVVVTPTSHGNGFANTGVLDQDSKTPQGSFGAITFSKPGIYNYVCLIHPFMRGKVVVS